MNLFSNHRDKFGQSTVQEVWHLEQANIKLARHRNHLKFNLHCKDAKVILASLNIACPIKTQKARDIIDRARKGLLKERLDRTLRKSHFWRKRSYNIVTDPKDAKAEVEHVKQALGKCGYPSWTFKKDRQQLDKCNGTPKKPKNEKDTDKKKEESPIMVSIPYVKGVLEALARAYRRHGVSAAMKPHLTSQCLVSEYNEFAQCQISLIFQNSKDYC